MEYLVFDTETTIKCPVGNNKGNPHWPANHLVCAAYITGEAPGAVGWVYDPSPTHANNNISFQLVERIEKSKIIVGQNLAFDLQWVMRCRSLNLVNKTLWDIAIAEYVISGQTHRFPSLDEMCDKYGLPKKDNKIKDMWDAGIDTDKIPKQLLIDYCCQDVKNTEKIYLKQLPIAKEMGVLDLILVLNDALLATSEMMFNGMKVDVKKLNNFIIQYSRDVLNIERYLKTTTKLDYGFPELNLDSPKQLSAVIYGGTLVSAEKVADGVFKTGDKAGQPRYKLVKTEHKLPGIFTAADAKSLAIPEMTFGGFSTDDESLSKLAKLKTSIYVNSLLEYRELNKQLSTYFTKTQELLFPGEYIYHNINNTATITGRYSSSEPNLQNVTSGEKSDIKKCYVTRYDNGYLVEIDFKQLEIVALAQLSKDKQLISDIEYGIDIHAELYNQVFGRIPTKEERRNFKRATFALLYGAGPSKIAKTVGISMADAKKFIASWSRRYPETILYWDKVHASVKASRQVTGLKNADGKPIAVGKYQMPTGRILTFTESYVEWRVEPDFSPNDTRNYPIQSFATGDLVPLFLGKLYRILLSQPWYKDNCVLVNTVHDSVILDCKKEQLDNLQIVLKNVFENMNRYIKKEFGIDMELKLETTVSYGPDWNNQLELS